MAKLMMCPKERAAVETDPETRAITTVGQHHAPIRAGILTKSVRKDTTIDLRSASPVVAPGEHGLPDASGSCITELQCKMYGDHSVAWCSVVWWCGVMWCVVVWCGVVVCCGVVWCAEGAVTKRQKAGMSTHG